jgi:type I restriction enzyme S subunit
MASTSKQREIVRSVRAVLEVAAAIGSHVKAATARADKLPHAILSKAFSGELVATEADLARAEGRPYETAEELLERVRREKAEDGAAEGSGVRQTAPRRR